jgi:hypothetical protein
MTNPLNPIDALVREFVEDYEMIGETEDGRDACHTPTEGERALIEDALHGFLADDRYTALLAQMQQPSDEREAQPVEQRAWDVELDEWVRATGAIPHGGSWHFELLSMLEEAAASSARALGPVKAQQEPAVLPETMSRDEMLAYYSNYANLCAHEALRYQKRIRDLEAKLAAHQGAQPAVPEAERIAELEDEVAHVRQWYGWRLEILSAWAREHLTGEALDTFFNIVANARPHVSNEPEWFRAVVRKLAAAPSASAQLQPTARCTAIRCTCKPSQMLTCDRMIDVAQEPQGEAQQPDSSAIRALKLGQPQQPQLGDFATAVPTSAPTTQPPEPRFQWCCENGCGTCDVKRIDYEYSRTEDSAGKVLESKTTPMLVSKCCGAALTMWDNLRDEEVSVKGAQL